jgi:hypothetical protein
MLGHVWEFSQNGKPQLLQKWFSSGKTVFVDVLVDGHFGLRCPA